MKKITLLFLAIFSLSPLLKAQDNGAVSSGKKIRIGAGLSLSTAASGYGLNFKGDYLLNDKLSVGLNSYISRYSPTDLSSAELTFHDEPGTIFNISAGASYYLLGSNSDQNKLGLYTGLGLGFYTDRQVLGSTTKLPVSDKMYYSYTKSYNYNYISSTFCLGADYKIGSGKLFFEMPIVVGLFSKNAQIYKTQQWGSGDTQPDYKADKFTKNVNLNDVVFNLGYKLYF